MIDKELVLLEQQKLLYSRIESSLSKRQSVNGVFITLLTFLIIYSNSLFALFLGIGLCITWIKYLKYLQAVNKSTFNVIDELEKKIGIQLNKMEYESFRNSKSGADYEKNLPYLMLIFISTKILYLCFQTMIFFFNFI